MAQHESLVAALAAFHAEAPKVIKDATVKVTGESRDGGKVSYSYGYADLATVTEALNPLLGKHGLAFTSKPTMTAQGFGLVYALKHAGGESDEGFWPLPDPTRVKPQELGSWITYWRRYAFLSVTNTFPSGEDDDGKQASSRERWDDARPRTEQAFDQHRRGVSHTDDPAPAAEKTEWTDAEVREMHVKIETAELGKAVNGYDWMAGKGLHERKIDVPTDDGPVGITATELLAARLADMAAKPDADLRIVAICRAYAEDRGLLKVQVSESTTLDEELAMARDLLVRADVQQAKSDTPDPQAE